MDINKDDIKIPGLNVVGRDSGLLFLDSCSDGYYKAGKDGVITIASTTDKKIEFISFKDRTLAYVKSNMGYTAYYPIHPVKLEKPVKAILMDLDGTTVSSEKFWIWIIEKTIANLLHNDEFELEDADMPFISGHSVSEHLKYCIDKYCFGESIEKAREYYYENAHHQMSEIASGRGWKSAFTPAKGLREFLLELKEMKVKIGLVTSGLYEKAYPEIVSAFDALGLGDPKEFYDCIITAGFPLKKFEVGTLGEMVSKPHPWLYSETCCVGLGIPFEERNSVVGIEDSGAGVCSIRLAGYPTIGISGGNIVDSGTKILCDYYCDSFEEIIKIIK